MPSVHNLRPQKFRTFNRVSSPVTPGISIEARRQFANSFNDLKLLVSDDNNTDSCDKSALATIYEHIGDDDSPLLLSSNQLIKYL
jgi:hypothetical protein